jgi:ABC-type uncharacterized transport system substrate-binding protein
MVKTENRLSAQDAQAHKRNVQQTHLLQNGGIMLNALRRIGLSVFILSFLLNIAAWAADKGNFSTSPTTKNGKKWRLAYYEGGEYIDYQVILIATIKGLMQLGWIEQTEIPAQKGEQTEELWSWFSTNIKSKYIEFVKDAHYSANWDDKLRPKVVEKIINRLNHQNDLDLVIAMGTWAGQDLSNQKHHTPTLAFSVNNAVDAGIIKSAEDSGLDHFYAQVDPTRFERQLRTFHDVVGFKKLGVAYEDTVSGRSIAAIDKIEQVGKERQFDILRCYTKDDVPDKKIAEETVRKCFESLSKQGAGAIYATMQNGISSNSIPQLAKIANSRAIPTFSQSGSHEVKWGFLMSLSQASYKYIGDFYSKVISKVLNGAKPRDLDQVFEEPPKIAINLKTAEIIGYNPPVDVMLAADEIFQEIETPPEQ